MPKLKHGLLGGWFLASLVGCASVKYVPPQNDLQYLAFAEDKTAVAALATKAFSPSDPRYWQLPINGAKPPIHSKLFQAELESIVEQLAVNFLIADSDFSVVGSDCSGYGARALMNGQIEICRGAVHQVESRSELAFLVCHELSHLVLGDLSKDRINILKYAVDGKFEDYDRKRELLADLLGIDICASAGFDPNAAYYSLLKQGSQDSSAKIDGDGKLKIVSKQTNETQGRTAQVRTYLRRHYPARLASVTQGDAFLFFSAQEQNSLASVYSSFLHTTEQLRSVTMGLNSGADVIRDASCLDVGANLNETGPSMQYDREWIAAVISYGWLCKSHVQAALMIEPATKSDHAHGSMHVVMSIFYNYASLIGVDTQKKYEYKESALRHYRIAMRQDLYDKPFHLPLGDLAYVLALGDRTDYNNLRSMFLQHCRRSFDPYPELFYEYWCNSPSGWDRAFRSSERLTDKEVSPDDSKVEEMLTRNASRSVVLGVILYPSATFIASDPVREPDSWDYGASESETEE